MSNIIEPVMLTSSSMIDSILTNAMTNYTGNPNLSASELELKKVMNQFYSNAISNTNVSNTSFISGLGIANNSIANALKQFTNKSTLSEEDLKFKTAITTALGNAGFFSTKIVPPSLSRAMADAASIVKGIQPFQQQKVGVLKTPEDIIESITPLKARYLNLKLTQKYPYRYVGNVTITAPMSFNLSHPENGLVASVKQGDSLMLSKHLLADGVSTNIVYILAWKNGEVIYPLSETLDHDGPLFMEYAVHHDIVEATTPTVVTSEQKVDAPAPNSTTSEPKVDVAATNTTTATSETPKKGSTIGLYVGIGAAVVVGTVVYMKFIRK